ncbi:protein phosphatase 1 regulatory subunit 1C isoform X7 [Ictalurus punctatus]|uniref:Protein phosphatase 1 regulatory subunit 1C isoform X7 n=1 Tax=Ictalurus punctatus TaxID=7998 RepID=A0A979EWG6_ICTPU|nr:protein phosphatase 1 regulatory subunit 1C isoform X7 [Ictalurus punctatus]
MEPNSPKKIQFAVPLFQSHLDPQAAEHIRKRRPTPATLVIYNDPNASDDKQSASGQSETQLSPAQRKTSVYTPPTMRGKDHSNKQRSSQEESPLLPKLTHSHLDTLSEEPTDRDAVDKPSTTRVMMKGEAEFSSAFREEEEQTFPEDEDTQEE